METKSGFRGKAALVGLLAGWMGLACTPAEGTKGVHVFLEVSVKNPELFSRYLKGYGDSFKKYGGRTVFVSRNLEGFQGREPGNIIALQKWPSEKAYRDWVASPEYRPWKKIRDESAELRVVIAR